MSYDLEHREIYKLTEAPVRAHGVLICGGRTTVITKTEGSEGFSVSVRTRKGDMDGDRCDIVRITPAMLAAMR